MDLLNRAAIIVRPAQPMIDWIRQVDLDMGMKPVKVEELHDFSNIYLIPEVETVEEATAYLQKRVERLFTEELSGWFTDPALWPKRDWKTFSKWMSWEFHEMVFDLERETIDRLDYSGYLPPAGTPRRDEGTPR